jgi:hypothetical protein
MNLMRSKTSSRSLFRLISTFNSPVVQQAQTTKIGGSTLKKVLLCHFAVAKQLNKVGLIF